MTNLRLYGRNAAVYGGCLLFPAVLFGGLLTVQLGHDPGAGWLAIVAGCAGVALTIYLPRPQRRVAIVLAVPAVGLLWIFVYAISHLPWRDPTIGEAVSVVVLAAAAFGVLSWALQWLTMGWDALRLDRG